MVFFYYCSLVISREAFFVSEGHRKPEIYRANLCEQYKFCASRSVLLGTEWTVTFFLYNLVKEFSIEGLQEKWFCVNMLMNVKRMFRKYYKNI